MNFSLNIGLNVGDTLRHSEAAVHAALAIVFPNAQILRSHIRRSIFGELTACVVLRCPETTVENLPGRLDFLCTHLEQEAVAAKANASVSRSALDGGTSTCFLCGPGALNWNGGAFNEEAWLKAVPENRPHADGEAVLIALSGTEHSVRGYTIGFHAFRAGGTIEGWFERQSDGTGGGLWLGGEGDGTLSLLDYDGTYALPLPVLDFLRTAGVNADRSFE